MQMQTHQSTTYDFTSTEGTEAVRAEVEGAEAVEAEAEVAEAADV